MQTAPLQVYSTASFGQAIGVSRVTVFNWIHRGLVLADWLGGRYVIPGSELDRFKREHPERVRVAD